MLENQMLKLVHDQAKYGFEYEKGTLKYACFTLEDNREDPSLWVIEDIKCQEASLLTGSWRYINGEAIQFHATADRMKEVFGYIASGVMTAPVKKTDIEFFDRLEFLRPTIAHSSSPFIHIVETSDEPRSDSEGISVWSDIVNIAKEDPDTLFFGVSLDEQDKSKIATIGAYVSKEAFLNQKMKIQAALESKVRGHFGDRKSVLLKLEAGFMYQEGLLGHKDQRECNGT
ncbi:hypothetical protein DPV78_005763 [Talaromyces pinophilus]|nr:hypothetical protein DPV78_005763 [Talaromyces pinophilus]